MEIMGEILKHFPAKKLGKGKINDLPIFFV